MTPEAQRIAIAELCHGLFWKGQYEDDFAWNKDVLADLNAMHEVEKTFKNDEVIWRKYWHHLVDVIEPHRHSLHATAAQKAEAFLRTLGRYTDTK